MNSRRFLDICSFILIISVLELIFSVLVLSLFTQGNWAATAEVRRPIFEAIGNFSLITFALSGLFLWIFALRQFWITMPERSLLLNGFYFFGLLGLSWVVALVVYYRCRKELVPAL